MDKISFAFRLIFLFTTLQFSVSEDYCTTCAQDTLKTQYGDIVYAGVIFRHGNRVPEAGYPNDPNANYSWPYELGQLVNEGKQRAFTLGKFLRPRYGHLVGEKWNPNKAITHGSSYDRTLMSGLLFMAGFFPPSANEVWNSELQWQPIPIHSAPPETDNVLRLTKIVCPRLEKLRNEFYEKGNNKIGDLCNKYKDQVAYIGKNSGLTTSPCRKYDSIWNLIIVQDTLLTETEQNLTLPDWTKTIFPNPINEFRDTIYAESADTRIARLYLGPFFTVLASDFLAVAGWKNYTLPKTIFTSLQLKEPGLHLFAAHDSNIVLLLRYLGVYPNKAPNYSAAVGFELRKKSGRYFVTVIYENSLTEKPQVMQLPKCKGPCPLYKFLSLITPLIPQDYYAECSLNYVEPVKTTSKTNAPKSGSNRKRKALHSA